MQPSYSRFDELMTAGQAALENGEHTRAHRLWRQAASLEPENEAVWLALLDVLKNIEDRRVCLQNVLYINPNNEDARQQLERYNAMVSVMEDAPAKSTASPANLIGRTAVWWIIILLLLVVMMALALEALTRPM